jgi:hypothetical protein
LGIITSALTKDENEKQSSKVNPNLSKLISFKWDFAILKRLWKSWSQFLATHFFLHNGQSYDEPSSVHLRIQWRWKWCWHWPWMGTQSSPGTLHLGQGASKANWQIVQHYYVSMSHFQVATAFHEFIFTFI